MRRRDLDRLADEELMIRVRERDQRALEVLYVRHGSAAFSLAHRVVGDRQGAEDVTQEAFVSLWRTGSSYRPERGSVRSWLLAIVRHRAVDALRRAHARVPPAPADAPPAEAQAGPQRTDDEALRREDARQVHDAIGGLPPDQARVIGLAYFGGFTHSEIAELLGLPLGTVKGRMRSALEKLRDTMDVVA